jgi:multiple sugar transport system permease protein
LTLFPATPNWSNYTQVFQKFPIGRQLLNSLLVVTLAVPLTLLTASLTGYAMAQLPPRPRRRLVVFTLLLLIVPIPALWLPRFVLFTQVGLNDSLLSLVVPALMGSSPFYILLFYWTFRRLPPDIFDSARLEGAGELHIWRRIALPLARPTLAVVSVLSFTLYWSDYISPLMYLRSENLYTYSLRLQMFTQQDTTNQPLAMAATVIAITPVVLLFLLVQRYFWPEGRKGLL